MKNVKNYIFILLCSFLILIFLYPKNVSAKSIYEDIFKEDYTDAINWFKEYYLIFKKVFDETNVEEDILISVVFPERIRYSVIRNYIETKTLKILYTKYGSEIIDFSIGDLQIKPSFAEKIEQFAMSDTILKKTYSKLIISGTDSIKMREERVKRLEKLPWQIFYISAFYEIVINIYDLKDMQIQQKIKFIASAYNHGFETGKSEIEDHIDLQFFPYGKHYPGNQYAYTDVALDFYLNKLSEIIN